jgi:hypothetical protein
MKTVETTPFIQDEVLEKHWLEDVRLQDAQQRLASIDLDRFWGNMTLPSRPTREDAASFVDLRHRDEPDSKHAIIMPLPYANGWGPHVAYRAKLLQDSLEVPQRVIVFPNNTAFNTAYTFAKNEELEVSSGRFDAIAHKQFKTLDALGVESFHYIGYSQGASVGAVALKLASKSGYFEAKASGLFEAPNMIARTKKELSKAFTAGGVKPLNRAVNDSGIPGLSEAQYSRGGLDAPKQLGKFAVFGLGTLRAANKAIKNGFTYNRFFKEVDMIDTSVPVLTGAALETKIADPELVAERGGIIVNGYGHEMGDNIVVHAIIGKLALQGQ